MALCERCKSRSERPCTYTLRTREYARTLLPALRHVGYRCGYALAVHGSLKTDIDIVAVPWRDTAIEAASFVERLRSCIEAVIGTARYREADKNPSTMPCGRLAWSIYLQPEGVDGPYIDLSVIPNHQDSKKTVKPRAGRGA